MKLVLTKDKKIGSLQETFNTAFPFLKLEFSSSNDLHASLPKRNLNPSSTLESAGLKIAGELELRNDMAVYELERDFQSLFGLNIQVCRKAGNIWLETTKTDKWSLQKQNDHGREISTPEKEDIPDMELNDIQ